MSFTNPIWLYGLLGLAIPIIIHLWSKKEGKTIKVGSIRFFPESETRQSRRLSPNEIPLLLLRCLVLIALVMLIAQPILIGKKKQERPTVLIDPLVLEDASLSAMMDSIVEGDYNIKLLQAGLPDYDADEGVEVTLPYWEAMPIIEQLASNEVLIFARNQASAFKGRLPSSSKQITWYHIPPRSPQSYVLKATHYGELNRLTLAHFDEGETRVENAYSTQLADPSIVQTRNEGGTTQFRARGQADWVTAEAIEDFRVLVRFEDDFELDAQLWTAAFNALWLTNGIPFEATMAPMNTVNEGEVDMLIWLSASAPNAQADHVLVYQADALAKELIKTTGSGGEITRRLSLENITSENAAEELLAKFFEDKDVKQQLAELDQRALSTELVEPAYSPLKGSVGKQNQAIPYIYWVLLMGLIGLERIVSYRKKQ